MLKQPVALALLLAGGALALGAGPAQAAAKTSFTIASVFYAGSIPWLYAQRSGILKRWADKYGIEIELTQLNDPVEGLAQFTAGAFDATLATNGDTLTLPAASGTDTTVLVVNDYSNGADGIVLKNATGLADIKGRSVNLIELSVSHYLLVRVLDQAGMSERDVRIVNTSDVDIASGFAATDMDAAVTWIPPLFEIARTPGAKLVYDSTSIPGEILDCMVVNTLTLHDNPAFGKALIGAWYETLDLMFRGDAASKEARGQMAALTGTDLAGFDAQMAVLRFYRTPREAADFMAGKEVIEAMDLTRGFAFDHGLYGTGATSKDQVGIAFPDGTILGDPANVKMRFEVDLMREAAAGGP